MFGGVFGEREAHHLANVDAIVQNVQSKDDPDGVRRLEFDVILRDISTRFRKRRRDIKEFFDREVWKLNDLRISTDNDDCFLVLPPPIRIQSPDPVSIEVKSEDFGQFLDSKGANSRYKTLQESASMRLVRLFDLPQHPLVCGIQAFRKLV